MISGDAQSHDDCRNAAVVTHASGRSVICARVTREWWREQTCELDRPTRLALTPNEAAQALGCSRDFFDEHIGPELRWVRRGRLKFVAITEIEDWLRRNAALTLEPE
jgi:hypothetical protein